MWDVSVRKSLLNESREKWKCWHQLHMQYMYIHMYVPQNSRKSKKIPAHVSPCFVFRLIKETLSDKRKTINWSWRAQRRLRLLLYKEYKYTSRGMLALNTFHYTIISPFTISSASSPKALFNEYPKYSTQLKPGGFSNTDMIKLWKLRAGETNPSPGSLYHVNHIKRSRFYSPPFHSPSHP